MCLKDLSSKRRRTFSEEVFGKAADQWHLCLHFLTCPNLWRFFFVFLHSIDLFDIELLILPSNAGCQTLQVSKRHNLCDMAHF
jgi:hypothetical protein